MELSEIFRFVRCRRLPKGAFREQAFGDEGMITQKIGDFELVNDMPG